MPWSFSSTGDYRHVTEDLNKAIDVPGTIKDAIADVMKTFGVNGKADLSTKGEVDDLNFGTATVTLKVTKL